LLTPASTSVPPGGLTLLDLVEGRPPTRARRSVLRHTGHDRGQGLIVSRG